MASLFTPPYLDVGSGISPSDGALLYFYVVGSGTPKNVYTTAAATTAHANPVVADAKGVFDAIYLSGDYDWVLQNKNGVQKNTGSVSEVITGDGSLYTTVSSLAATSGSSLSGFIQDGAGATARTVQDKARELFSVIDFGAIADGATDNYAAIEAALVEARLNKGKVFFPVNRDGVATVYNYSQTLQYNASDAIIEGESTSVQLTYTGTGTGLACKITPGGSSIERWGLRNISLVSTTGAIALDYTGGNYGNYENVEINYTAANAEMLYAIGNTGAGPYFNKFDGMTFFGSAGRTQEAIVMKSDASGNLADGPNANVFSNIKRGASLSRLINLVSGTGNMFTNIGGESISDALIVLNEVPSFSDSGTSTGTTTNTLTDTSKTWSTTLGDALNFTNDAVTLTSGIPGETRRIVSNTATILTLDRPFSQNPGATVTYNISNGKAVKNMFVNVRQEGLNTDNPDGIRAAAGARGNEFAHIEIGSLGTGVVFDDESQDQTNKIAQGDLIVQQYIIENPGASATVEVIPRSTVFGGIRSGSNMCLEYIELSSPNFTPGTATLTVDHGGSAAGNGTESHVVLLDSVNTKEAYKSCNKVMRSTSNAGIYASLTTAGAGAADDYIINIAYRVQ